ncbi:hypothetical protein A2755_02255 [Candidatus Wolfebacteria bacterium RIFCSPHIGHO2_01_FULL_48_22]|uniref:Uncharacterized protein n=2 Tax=Candidatus Wolfeibacteriota TaxID=1752735 RepID=A0A1F8DTP7_9BACT|nr:MAG: hypothetical protein A2755_02255 [Candidatus Wolfebacteria bacterium RIFCSPHIGHO2_01_FULL_48_22]OGM92296.1 MAG: hypothetical protein A2935_00815 [Candidatus Wolfebacteria bacterium RIFCSPLOWO2_01_FULL_47_17b]
MIEAILKRKKDLKFLVMGFLLLAITAYLFIHSITFLAITVDDALNEEAAPAQNQKFNLKGLETLGILRPSPTSVLSPSPTETATSSPEATP